MLLVQPAVVFLPVDPEDNHHFCQGWKAVRSLGSKHRAFQGEIPSALFYLLRPNLNEAGLLNGLMEEVKEGMGQPKGPPNLLGLLSVRGQNQVA